MRFTWDERKRKSNLRDHGFDLRDSPRVFEGPTFTFEDDHFAYAVIRVISFRRATRREEAILLQSLKD